MRRRVGRARTTRPEIFVRNGSKIHEAMSEGHGGKAERDVSKVGSAPVEATPDRPQLAALTHT